MDHIGRVTLIAGSGLMLYLCPDIAANITGSHFVIDNGRTGTIEPFTRH